MMRRIALVTVLMLMIPGAALAQDDFDDFDPVEDDVEDPLADPVAPAPEPAPAPPPRVAEAPAPDTATDEAGSDHDRTVGKWGAQVAAVALDPTGTATDAAVPFLGVRKWSSRNSGWEAGAALRFQSFPGSDATLVMLGGTFGYLRALGVYEHMTVFWEPQGTILIALPNDGIDGTDDDASFLIDGRFNVGAEVRMGFFGLPQLGLTARIGAGVRISQTAGDTAIDVGTFGVDAASVRGLLESTVGFVMYF